MNVGQICHDPMDLARVAMPLIRLMRDGGLSWAQKEEIAGLIRDLCRERSDFAKEQQARDLSGQLQQQRAMATAGLVQK